MNICIVAPELLYHSLIILIEFATDWRDCKHIKILEIDLSLLHGSREKNLPPTNYASVHSNEMKINKNLEKVKHNNIKSRT